jgi:hypothetical protein
MGDLVPRLLALGYTELFQRLDDEALVELWREDGAPEALRTIALDDDEDARARFLAAEVVLSKDPARFGDDERPALATLYETALRGQFTGSGNEWSFPNRPLGRAGEHLVGLGTAAIPALTRLLGDESSVIYEGSREAMGSDSYAYRVNDLAAQFISRITGLPFDADPDPAVRDEAIAALKAEL